MYSLRSRGNTERQATLDFPCRKRRQAESKLLAKENTSPEKKAKPAEVPLSKSSSRRSTRSHRQLLMGPLSEVNQPEETLPQRTDDKRVEAKSTVATPPVSKLQEAKSMLHSNSSSSLVGREEEMATLRLFLEEHLDHHQPGSLYISGPPGTGKTATVARLLEESNSIQPSPVMVNCMSISQPHAIYSKIYHQLKGGCSCKDVPPHALEQAIVKHITSSKKMILLVLDEVDQLSGPCQHVLYSIFEWPALTNSRLVLIGIANALDFTDRILPRLQAHTKLCPQLLHYPPYSKEQLSSILSCRLSSTSTVVDPMAVQFCSRKVAAIHGDARKALDICRAAIELVETQQRCQKGKPTNTSSSHVSAARVTIGHVASVVSKVYGGGRTEEAMPVQQKLAVCSLLLMVRERSTKEVTLSKLYQVYTSVCRQHQLKYESQTEFVGLLQMLETRGIVSTKRAKEAMLTKVSLRQQEGELEHTLQDKVLLSSVLANGIPSL